MLKSWLPLPNASSGLYRLKVSLCALLVAPGRVCAGRWLCYGNALGQEGKEESPCSWSWPWGRSWGVIKWSGFEMNPASGRGKDEQSWHCPGIQVPHRGFLWFGKHRSPLHPSMFAGPWLGDLADMDHALSWCTSPLKPSTGAVPCWGEASQLNLALRLINILLAHKSKKVDLGKNFPASSKTYL